LGEFFIANPGDRSFVLLMELRAHKAAEHGGADAGKEEEEAAAEEESDQEAVGSREPAAPAAGPPSAEDFVCSMCGVEVSLYKFGYRETP
jgi:hypothetical protein